MNKKAKKLSKMSLLLDTKGATTVLYSTVAQGSPVCTSMPKTWVRGRIKQYGSGTSMKDVAANMLGPVNLPYYEGSLYGSVQCLDYASDANAVPRGESISSISSQAGFSGHAYNSLHRVKLPQKGAALAILNDPAAILDLFSCFPNGVMYTNKDTMDILQAISTTEKRQLWILQNPRRIPDEDAALRQLVKSGNKLPIIGAILGGTDMVYLTNHMFGEEKACGIKYQGITAGTTMVHSMCGGLGWRMFVDPTSPDADVLCVDWFGAGQSYVFLMDIANNLLVRYMFQQMAHSVQYYRQWRLNDEGYDNPEDFLWSKDKSLWFKRWFSRHLMAQKSGEILNEIFRSKRQLDVATLIDSQKANALVAQIKKDAEALVPIVKDPMIVWNNIDKPDVLGGGSGGTAEAGVWVGANRIVADMPGILGATRSFCWEPTQRQQLTDSATAVMMAKFAPELSSLQEVIKQAASPAATSPSPPSKSTSNQVATVTIPDDTDIVFARMMDRGMFDNALDRLRTGRKSFETEWLAKIKGTPLGAYAEDSLSMSARRLIWGASEYAACAEPSSALGAAIQTAVLNTQIAENQPAQVAANTEKAQKLVDDALATAKKATTPRAQAQAKALVDGARANFESQQQLQDTITNASAKKADCAKQEAAAKTGFANAFKEGLDVTLRTGDL